MELFIHIPYEKRGFEGKMLEIIKSDFAESIAFIRNKKPVLGKGMFVICGINLFLSAMILVSLPYMVTEVLTLDADKANQLYGYAQGVGNLCIFFGSPHSNHSYELQVLS